MSCCLGLANLQLWLCVLGTDRQLGSSWWGARKPWKSPVCSQWFQQQRRSQLLVSEGLGSPFCSPVTLSLRGSLLLLPPSRSVVSDSVRPHRRQPTRLRPPWDSPGKNTGVGCHFLLQCMKVKSEREVTQSCLTPSDPMDCSPPGSYVPGIPQARVLEWGAMDFSRKGRLAYAF